MPFVPLKLPSGIFRPGTQYDARGRWYDSNLVRWADNAMQAIGGWRPMERTTDVAVSAAISDDGGVFTDETTDANDAGQNDIVLIPASPAVNDAFYVGYSFRFTEILLRIDTQNATDGAVTWEYYNGSAWAALSNVNDNTNSFKNPSSSSFVVFDLPWDWAKTTVNGQGPFYYVRARVTTPGTTTAIGTQVWIGNGPVDVDEPVRGMLAWRANSQAAHLAIGTPTKSYVLTGGVLTDATVSGFTTGGGDAAQTSGNYNNGVYGAGPYGTGDPAATTITETNSWQFDTFGEDLVACAFSDGRILTWDTSVGGAMTVVSNAPTGCKGVVVTPERFLVALAASSDGRLVKWADQETMTTWTATATNQAGDFTLPGTGQIMAGRRGRNETLIWTDVELYAMRYIGPPFVFSFVQLGAGCGAISRRSMGVFDGKAAWMGPRGFFVYNGDVTPLPCDVGDYVFNDMNVVQASKISCEVLSEFGEVTWRYCSGGATENDRYVTYNYREGHWQIGQLQRTSGVDRDAFGYPIAADANGVVYAHETGNVYLDHEGEALTPFAESGPMEIAHGDNIIHVQEFIPDERTLGDARVYVYSAMYPTSTETTHGPYTLTNPTSARLAGRQVRVKVEQVRSGWRFGTPRLNVVLGGQR